MEAVNLMIGKPIRQQLLEEGALAIDRDMASLILSDCHFPGQRKISPHHVKALGATAANGNWLERDQITFCRLPSGKLYLVNGYHRLHMVILFEQTIEFSLRIIDSPDEEDVRMVYSSFDHLSRKRSEGDMLSAREIPQKYKVPKAIAVGIYRAIPLIQNGFKALNYQDSPSMVQDMVSRIRSAEKYWAYASKWHEYLGPAIPTLRQKFHKAAFTAVALVTIKYQPDMAAQFWPLVSSQDGLGEGDPRRTLNRTVLSTHYSTKFTTGSIPLGSLHAAIAWSAFYEGKSCNILRNSRKFRIAGTPY